MVASPTLNRVMRVYHGQSFHHLVQCGVILVAPFFIFFAGVAINYVFEI